MPLKKSGSPEAFKSNVKAEMHSGKPQKQALAIAYSTKRAAMGKKKMAKGGSVLGDNKSGMTNPDSELQSSDVCHHCQVAHEGGEVCQYAEGGMVDSERSLKTSPKGPNHELDVSKEDMERSEFGYGEMSEVASMAERDEPSRHGAEQSLSEEIMRDRKRRSTNRTQPMDNDSRVQDKEMSLDNDDSMKDKLPHRPASAMSPDEDIPRRSQPRNSEDELAERDDSNRAKLAMGGRVEVDEQAYSNKPSMVGSLDDGIDEPDMSSPSNNKDEVDPDGEDGRESRGLNLEPVHEMTDSMHDQESASKDSDYEEHDDSLVGEILRDRKRRRREE